MNWQQLERRLAEINWMMSEANPVEYAREDIAKRLEALKSDFVTELKTEQQMELSMKDNHSYQNKQSGYEYIRRKFFEEKGKERLRQYENQINRG